jgi:hypothetical protein
MNKGTSIALLVAGLLLLAYGVHASESVGSGFSRLFTGAPTDKTVYLMVGGILASIVGLFGLMRGAK